MANPISPYPRIHTQNSPLAKFDALMGLYKRLAGSYFVATTIALAAILFPILRSTSHLFIDYPWLGLVFFAAIALSGVICGSYGYTHARVVRRSRFWSAMLGLLSPAGTLIFFVPIVPEFSDKLNLFTLILLVFPFGMLLSMALFTYQINREIYDEFGLRRKLFFKSADIESIRLKLDRAELGELMPSPPIKEKAALIDH